MSVAMRPLKGAEEAAEPPAVAGKQKHATTAFTMQVLSTAVYPMSAAIRPLKGAEAAAAVSGIAATRGLKRTSCLQLFARSQGQKQQQRLQALPLHAVS